MHKVSKTLFIEINLYEYIFLVGENLENEEFKLIYKNSTPLIGIKDNKISDFDLIYNTLKKNILVIEQELNIIFKEAVIILNNLNSSLINFSGYKKLNGSQLAKENITYIINSLKSKISETENQKKIIHIFNSKYLLDKKKIENLPVGLFGNFYSQELSFFLIDNNDYKNLRNIFDKCNLRVKKLISKKFLEGAKLISENSGLETFFKIIIDESYIEILFFENSALKFTQKFDFGSDIVLNDISKIIAVEKETLKNILLNSNFSKEMTNDTLIEKDFFNTKNFRKIKKKLVIDIADARVQEIAEIIFFKNINIQSFLKNDSTIYLNINDFSNLKCFADSYISAFGKDKKLKIKLIKQIQTEELYKSANNLVQYGWKKEAVPIIQEKKSLITRFFDLFFN